MNLQDRVQSLLDQLTASGHERGLQCTVYRHGKLVVDAASGIADVTTGQKVNAETLFPVFSVSKGIAATLAHLIVERGHIRYSTPVAQVWPEFAAGKEHITFRQLLNHSAGLPHVPSGIGFKELCDWDYMCAALAKMAPTITPGTRIEYHAMTFGWLVGEVLRRVDGRTFEQLMAQELRRPLQLDGLYIGIPDEVESRVAIIEEPKATPPPAPTGPESVPSWMGPLYAAFNRPDTRRACMPASSGIMNARSIARVYASLLPGGIDGVELLPPSRIHTATERQKPDHPVDDYPKNWGLGYALDFNEGGRVRSFGHGGYGGSQGMVDLESKFAIGFTKNLFNDQDTFQQILAMVRE